MGIAKGGAQTILEIEGPGIPGNMAPISDAPLRFRKALATFPTFKRLNAPPLPWTAAIVRNGRNVPD
jgi:hypothetical protein